MLLRQASIGDVQRIAALQAASWQSAYRGILRDDYLNERILDERRALWAQKLATLKAEDHVTLLLEAGDRLAGFVCIVLDIDAKWGSLIDNLHVDPGLKGKGHGRRLVKAAALSLWERGERGPLFLWVFEQNLAARGFYARIGGLMVEQAPHSEPDGTSPMALRYVWPSPQALLDGVSA